MTEVALEQLHAHRRKLEGTIDSVARRTEVSAFKEVCWKVASASASASSSFLSWILFVSRLIESENLISETTIT